MSKTIRKSGFDRAYPCRSIARRVLYAYLGGALLTITARTPVHAACNLIPQAQRSFRSALGATDRPYATPGDFVELSVRPMVCDAASPGFSSNPDDYVVTLIFQPPSNGPRRVVVVTTDDCNSLTTDAKVQDCGMT